MIIEIQYDVCYGNPSLLGAIYGYLRAFFTGFWYTLNYEQKH